MDDSAKKLIMVPADRLIPTKNPFPEGDVNALAESITQVGLQYPLLVSKDGDGKYEILDGRTRYKALKKLGWDMIPCILVENDDLGLGITYSVELYRRHIGDDQMEQIMDKYKKDIESYAIEFIGRNIHDETIAQSLTAIVSEDESGPFRAIRKVRKYMEDPELLQVTVKGTEQKIIEEKEKLQTWAVNLETQLREKNNRLEILQAKIAELTKTNEEYRKMAKQQIELLVEKRIQEILATEEYEEEKAKRIYDKIYNEVKTAVEKEKNAEIEEKHKQLVAISNQMKAAVAEKEKMEQQLRSTREQIDRYESYIEKIKSDFAEKQDTFRKILAANKVSKRIDSVREKVIEMSKEIVDIMSHAEVSAELLTGDDIRRSLDVLAELKEDITKFLKTTSDLEKLIRKRNKSTE